MIKLFRTHCFCNARLKDSYNHFCKNPSCTRRYSLQVRSNWNENNIEYFYEAFIANNFKIINSLNVNSITINNNIINFMKYIDLDDYESYLTLI